MAESSYDLGKEDGDELGPSAACDGLEGGADDEKIIAFKVCLDSGCDHDGEFAGRIYEKGCGEVCSLNRGERGEIG